MSPATAALVAGYEVAAKAAQAMAIMGLKIAGEWIADPRRLRWDVGAQGAMRIGNRRTPKKQDALAGKASYLLTRWCGVERVGMTTAYMQVYSAALAILFVEKIRGGDDRLI
jgi:hypothetical protein